MHTMRNSRFLITHVFLFLLLTSLLAACSLDGSGTGSSPTTQTTPSGSTSTTATTPTAVTQPVPPTQTDCPADDTARAMVTAPMAPGKHQQVIYMTADTKDTGGYTQYNRIVRYDTVTHTSTDIIKFPSTLSIVDVSLSGDGQWLLITDNDNNNPDKYPRGVPQLQAIRVDGQGLQTLYCFGDGSTMIWSPDRHWIAFAHHIQYPGSPNTVYLLDTTSGKILSGVDIPQQNGLHTHDPFPFFWLSNTQLYLTDMPGSTPYNTYLVDTTKGEHQQLSTLPVINQQLYTSATTNGTTLFFNELECQRQGITYCPSKDITKSALASLPVQGGTAPQIIFQDPHLVIGDVSMLDAQTLLFFADNQTTGTREVWTVKSDGTGPKRIANAQAAASTLQYASSKRQYADEMPWSTISPDRTQFLARDWPNQAGDSIQPSIGSVQSGAMSPLPTDGFHPIVVGWTLL